MRMKWARCVWNEYLLLKKEKKPFVLVVLKKVKETGFFIVVSLIIHMPRIYSVFVWVKNRKLEPLLGILQNNLMDGKNG